MKLELAKMSYLANSIGRATLADQKELFTQGEEMKEHSLC